MTTPLPHIDPFLEHLADQIDRRRLIAPGQHVLVALSGGPDSLALLAGLRDLAGRPGRGYALTAAHLHHNITSAGDEALRSVIEITRRWDIPLIAERRDVPGIAADEGVGIEQAARDQRYEFLAAAAGRGGCDLVATGHHADDQAETVLNHILRGTHLRGLSGMVDRRAMPGSEWPLIRPLLSTTRVEILAFCRRAGLDPVTDPTNTDTDLRRNYIRHELLPAIRARINPRADDALRRLAAAAGEVEDYLADQGRALLNAATLRAGPGELEMDVATLVAEPPLVRSYAAREACRRVGIGGRSLTSEHIEALAGLAGEGPAASANLPEGFVARRRGGRIELLSEAAGRRRRGPALSVRLIVPGTTPLGDGRAMRAKIEPLDMEAFGRHCRRGGAGEEMLDADRVVGALTARSRATGDAFRPLGAPGRANVGEFLTNLRLTDRQKRSVLCVCDEEGIVWLAPHRLADRVKVTPGTSRVLRLCLTGRSSR